MQASNYDDPREILSNRMPKRIRAEYSDDGERWQAQGSNVWFSDEESTEYIRADVAAEQLEAANWRTYEANETADWQLEQANGLRRLIAERDAQHAAIVEQWKIEEQMWRDADKKQLARIAELEAAPSSHYDLHALRRCADDACDAAPGWEDTFAGEPINWADLSCVGAEYIIGDYEDTNYRVIIAEASPRCCKLQAFIREHLAQNGFIDVEVVTEW